MPFYCECAKILTLIEEYRLTILPSEMSKRWRVLSNDCHPAHRRKFFGETLNAAVSKAIDYETKRRLEKEANDGEIYASGKKAAEGEMMEDILRDVQAMISGNKQLRTALRTMQAERDQLRAEVERLRGKERDDIDECVRVGHKCRIENAEQTHSVKWMLGRLEDKCADWASSYSVLYSRANAATALATSPDDHARRLKSEALRATASELESLRDHIQTEIGPDDARDDIRRICLNRAKDLRETAERLEKEAPNATR